MEVLHPGAAGGDRGERARAGRGENTAGRSRVAGADGAGPSRDGRWYRPVGRAGATAREALDGIGSRVYRWQSGNRTLRTQLVAARGDHPGHGHGPDAGDGRVRLQGDGGVEGARIAYANGRPDYSIRAAIRSVCR